VGLEQEESSRNTSVVPAIKGVGRRCMDSILI